MNNPSHCQFSFLDHLLEAICVLNSEEKIIYYNHYFSQLFRVPPRLLKNQPPLTEVITELSSIMARLLSSVGPHNVQSSGEELAVQLHSAPNVRLTLIINIIFLPEMHSYLVTFLNISDEKNLHEKYREKTLELQETHQQIVQADKIKSLVDISAGISHEISTPLAIARGNLEMVLEWLSLQTPENSKIHQKKVDQLSKALKAIDTIKNIIANIRTFSTPHNDTREYYDLKQVIDDALGLMGKKSSYQVQVQVAPNLHSCVTIINKIEIQQVVINIIKNAIDAIEGLRPSGGQIMIEISQDLPGHHLVCSFADNGPGIPPDDREKVFDIFYTTKKSSHGSGLGLTISKKIMEKHHGRIEIGTGIEGGAKISLIFPKAAIGSLSVDQGLLANFLNVEKRKIMLIDDQVEVLNIMNQIISDIGHMVIASTTPQDALHLLSKIEVDLIITDYLLPEITGTILVRKIRETHPTIPIIYMSSGLNYQHYLQDRNDLKIFTFLEKPFNEKTVQTTIEQVFNLVGKQQP